MFRQNKNPNFPLSTVVLEKSQKETATQVEAEYPSKKQLQNLQRKLTEPSQLKPADVLMLQRILGNRAVTRLLTKSTPNMEVAKPIVQRLRLRYELVQANSPDRRWRKLRPDENKEHSDTSNMEDWQLRRVIQELIDEKNDELLQELLNEISVDMLKKIANPEQDGKENSKKFIEAHTAVKYELEKRLAPQPSNPLSINSSTKGGSNSQTISKPEVTSAKRDFKIGDRVILESYEGEYHGIISKIEDETCVFQHTEEGAFKGKEITVNKGELKPDIRQVGLPGLSYMGPVRPDKAKEVNNRSDLEVEEVNGKFYVRLYLTVPAEAKMNNSSKKDKENQEKGVGQSKFKDVQQDAKSGKIVISTGDNSMLWVGGGRPLRALKWAEKYIMEHQVKAAKAKSQQEQFEQMQSIQLIEIEKLQKHINTLQSNKKFTEKQLNRLMLLHKKQERAQELIKSYQPKIEQSKKDYTFHSSIKNPLIRTYLFPLDKFNEITQAAALESQINLEKDGVKVNEDKTFNVDRHYEPNQYGFKGKDLETLRENALSGSLITYAYDPTAVPQERSGEVRDASELRDRLGIPQQDLKERQWTEGGEFTDKKQFKPMADTLNAHYVTWLQSKQKEEERRIHPLLSGNPEIPFSRRKQEMLEFLKSNGVPESEVDKFMEGVVAPWATQNAIAQMMSDDYERMNRDVNITDKPYANNYDQLIQEKFQEQQKQSLVGQQISKMIESDATPKAIIDLVIDSFPELKSKFEEVCAKTENYQFYDHAQMVLGQYLKLVKLDKVKERVIPVDAVVKAIIFHDIEKENSKEQYTNYGQGKQNKKKKAQQKHDAEGEHKLSVDMMGRYNGLWSSKKDLKVAVGFVDADPFGFYLRGLIEADAAFTFIVRLAKKQRVPISKIKDFFYEYHQYFQADFSSYTSDSTYSKSGSEQVTKGKETSLGKYLQKNDDQNLQFNEQKRGFEYSEVEKNYKQRFAKLEAMFSSPEEIERKFQELVSEEEKLETFKNKRRFAESN